MTIPTSLEYLVFNNPIVSIRKLPLCSGSGVQAAALCEGRMGFVHRESPLWAMSLFPLYTGVTRNLHDYRHSLSSSKAGDGWLFTWGLCWEECSGKPGAGLPRGKRGPGGSDEQVGTVGLGLSPMDVQMTNCSNLSSVPQTVHAVCPPPGHHPLAAVPLPAWARRRPEWLGTCIVGLVGSSPPDPLYLRLSEM